MGRERDDNSENIDTNSLLDDELSSTSLYMSKNAIAVEELDSDSDIVKESNFSETAVNIPNATDLPDASSSNSSAAPADFS